MYPIEVNRKAMKEAFVVGDIHGMFEELDLLLTFWRSTDQQLIFVGDYIDRGYASAKVLKCIWELEKDYQAICLRGNHEEMLLNYLKNPTSYFNHYVLNGGASTLSQLLEIEEESIVKSQARKLARQIKSHFPHLEEWLTQRPYFTTYGNFIIVHAGVDLSLNDWQNTSSHDFLWLRDKFHSARNTTNKQIIFGHTPNMVLHQNYHDASVWREDMKWGIDGGCVYGGELHALQIRPNVVVDIYSVPVLEGDINATS